MSATDADPADRQSPERYQAGAPVEQLVIWPHRSLGRGGTAILIAVVGAAFAAISIWAILTGAWPMLFYAALAMGGFVCALSCNNRCAEFAQVIEFTPGTIRVCEIGPASKARETLEFNPFWVRVVDATGPRDERRLLLRQSGRSVAIGDYLSPEERAELAAELRNRIAQRYFHGASGQPSTR